MAQRNVSIVAHIRHRSPSFVFTSVTFTVGQLQVTILTSCLLYIPVPKTILLNCNDVSCGMFSYVICSLIRLSVSDGPEHMLIIDRYIIKLKIAIFKIKACSAVRSKVYRKSFFFELNILFLYECTCLFSVIGFCSQIKSYITAVHYSSLEQ